MSAYPYRKILVPLDFSDDSRRALDHAAILARASGAELVLLTVIQDAFPYPELFALDRPGEEFYKSMRERALAGQAEAVGRLDPAPEAQSLVVRGRPREEITAMAQEIGADLVVMARRGRSGLRNVLMGNTIDGVVRSSTCPVLVLPPGDGS